MLKILYELKEILLIQLGIIIWFGAQLYVEKTTREKVNIALIELMTWVPLRKAALLICEGFCCLAFIKCFGGLVEDFKGGIVPYLLLTSCIIAFAVGIRNISHVGTGAS